MPRITDELLSSLDPFEADLLIWEQEQGRTHCHDSFVITVGPYLVESFEHEETPATEAAEVVYPSETATAEVYGEWHDPMVDDSFTSL